jgi:flagellar motor protein MotB
MAGKGGGAWKVAYADFVTAMMAFFLVMWLISQDQKIKESIAHYFQGPSGIDLLGDTARQKGTGGLFYSEVMGPVPGQTDRAAGRSIGTSPETPDFDNETMVVAEWILESHVSGSYWTEKARKILEQVRKETPYSTDDSVVEKAAGRALARDMRSELTGKSLEHAEGVYRDLMLTTLAKVDWSALADECLLRCRTHGP